MIEAAPENNRIDVCVCTYRRLQIKATLESLAKLALKPGRAIRIIVADNDDTPRAKKLVEDTARQFSLDLRYIHAPARNISIARNACLDAASAPLVAFIDDDEIASPEWLEALADALEQNKADVALGPVDAVYGSDFPAWMREGDFHSTRPVWVTGVIITGYTCNTIFRREALKGLRFRIELGRSGGEDTLFFAALNAAGSTIAYAETAIVSEAVTPERARLSWLIKRYFRAGQTHGLLLLEYRDGNPLTRTRIIAMEIAKIGFCYVAALPNLTHKARALFWVLRGTMHAGVLARLLGKREIEQYG